MPFEMPNNGLTDALRQEFAGKSVIIAGGAGGIGAELVKGFYTLGAKVVIMDRTATAAQLIADALPSDDTHVQPAVVAADLSLEAPRQQAMRDAIAQFGPPVGFISTIGFDQRMDLDAITQDDMELALRINFIAPLMAARDAMTAMRQASGGVVCLFTSRHGSEIFEPGMTEYGASKAALDNGMRHLAVHAGHGNTQDNIIRVFGFCPGWVQTPGQTSRFSSEIFEQARHEQLVPVGMQASDLVMPVIFNMSRYATTLSGRVVYYDGGEGQIKSDSVSRGAKANDT